MVARRHAAVLYDLMRIPGPAVGRQSADIAAFVSHSRDATAAMRLALRLLDVAMSPGPPGYETADEVAAEARAWLARRTAEGWQ